MFLVPAIRSDETRLGRRPLTTRRTRGPRGYAANGELHRPAGSQQQSRSASWPGPRRPFEEREAAFRASVCAPTTSRPNTALVGLQATIDSRPSGLRPILLFEELPQTFGNLNRGREVS